MIKSILLPLDGSRLAESVLPYASELGAKTGAELSLFTSIHQVDAWTGYLAQVDTGQQSELAAIYLKEKAEELRARGLKVRTDIAYGAPAETILNFAADQDINLIAMSTHGRSGITRWAFGSVADKVLHGTHRPLLLVRGAEQGHQTGVISKILVPLDGSKVSLAVLPFVEELAQKLGASLVLFHALPLLSTLPGAETAPLYVGNMYETLQAQAEQLLGRVEKEVKQRGIEVSRLVAIGSEVTHIVQAAQETGADLIALSTHGRSGLDRWVMGSAAEGVVRRTTLPCLVIRPLEAGEPPADG